MTWSASHAPWMRNEKLDFYQCTLLVPRRDAQSSFPNLEAKFNQSDVFNRRKRKITISASKTYGPDVPPGPQLGVDRTISGSANWKLTSRASSAGAAQLGRRAASANGLTTSSGPHGTPRAPSRPVARVRLTRVQSG